MEREIKNLRDQLASQQSSSPTAPPPSIKAPDTASPTISNLQSNLDHYIDSEEAVASLLDLRSGLEGGSFLRSPNGHIHPARRIESVTLQQDRVLELFRRFFRLFHPFMPLLEPEKSADHYYDASPLLFWTIISVAARHYPSDKALLTSLSGPLSRLLWATLADVPQSYIVVKALCLLCTWPLPISSTSSDPTFMLSGLLLTIAMQIGLHRPSHAQDFARFRVEFREEELKDRVKTWGAVNAVVQRVATGLGQPPSTVYDWTLEPSGADEINYHLPQEVQARLTIERFCNKVTKAFYSNRSDPVGLVDDSQRSSLTDFLARDLEDIEESLGPNLSGMYLYTFSRTFLLFPPIPAPGTSRISIAFFRSQLTNNKPSPLFTFELLVSISASPHSSTPPPLRTTIFTSSPFGWQLLRFLKVYLNLKHQVAACYHMLPIIYFK